MSRFLVTNHECDQCLFSKERIVSSARMKDVLSECSRKDTYFVCHKATIEGHNVACRGWFERFSCNLSRIAERLGAVKYVDPETGL